MIPEQVRGPLLRQRLSMLASKLVPVAKFKEEELKMHAIKGDIISVMMLLGV